MKNTLLTILKALGGQLTTEHPNVVTRAILYAIVAIAAALVVMSFTGCMATTHLDGKSYSWRLDILTPIGQTVNHSQPAPIPTTSPAADTSHE